MKSPKPVKAWSVRTPTDLMRDALTTDWDELWTFFNWFASGESQGQYARAEPLAVLGEVYQRLAIIDARRRAAIASIVPIPPKRKGRRK